ncbi:hypothetical protein [Terrimonas pollutisoli]|uniref:hypothetical protein n=1 Tax=Terrimonas pollutisoli TaxID=3034147 RepID=UPI0023ED70B9|nr:hypothetical protein [Terrimonas sp. H1YJ31]
MEEAENYSDSSNHEKAWEKMELLLDEHLPVKKKRRRFIYLLFPLLLGGGIALFFLQKRANIDHSISQQQNSTVQKPVTSSKNTITVKPSEKISSNKNNDSATPLIIDDVTTTKTTARNHSNQQDQSTIKNDLISQKATGTKSTTAPVQKQKYLQSKQPFKNKAPNNNQSPRNVTDHKNEIASQDVTVTVKDNEEKKNIEKINVPQVDSNAVAKIPEDTSTSQTDTTGNKATETVKKATKKTSSLSKNLSFSFSFGPDISSVGIDRPGKLALPYGIGVSYALSKKVSIRTGFFVGKKIYDADSADYHPPANFWNYYSNLQKIDANCLVYEIPVSVVYNFTPGKKHSWFVSGGLSSYLMKKEAYDYYYKNSWGQPQLYHRTYKNENSHFFSVLNLSGGYRYSVSDRVSLMGEPYVKVPVSGVGYGKVKLNSGGIMFTVSVKPFLKKN